MATYARLIGRRTALAGLAASTPLLRARAQPAGDDIAVAARREGTVVFHTSIDVSLCQKMIEGFNAREPGIRVQLERTGAERILQRISQEYDSGIHAADVVENSDTGTFLEWSGRGWLSTFLPPNVLRDWPAEERDPGSHFASVRASLSVIAYNTRQVKPEDAPKSFADLLQPRWRMRMVKSHPSYSGATYTATVATVKALGWDYMEKLAKQRVLQVQSATEPPKKVAVGERPVAVDGAEYVYLAMIDEGAPMMTVYAPEGSPIYSGQACVMEKAAHPNAARVFMTYLFSRECQQIMSDVGALRSFHPEVKEKPSRVPLSQIKLLRSTPAELAANAEEVKRRYSATFGV